MAFVYKLYDMVNEPAFSDLICWDKTGKSFYVFNEARFSKEVLPLYYKTNSITSFTRQLNHYGFHKIQDTSWMALDMDQLQYENEYFQRGKKNLLEFIRRKKQKPVDAETLRSRQHMHDTVKWVVPSFVLKVWSMVENPAYDESICWSKSGNSFLVLQPEKFCKKVLPFYYKHNNMPSFVRQLNTYGFYKIQHFDERGNFLANVIEYQHDYFKKGQKSLLHHIKHRHNLKEALNNAEYRSAKELQGAINKPSTSIQRPKAKTVRKDPPPVQEENKQPVYDFVPAEKRQRMLENAEEGIARTQALQRTLRPEKDVLEIPNHASSVLQSLHDQQKTGKFCDIMFKTATGFISAHRSVIFSSANALGDKNQTWLEVIEKNNSIVNIFDEFSQEIVQQLFMLMYTGKIILSSEEEFENLKRVAVKLRFNKLLTMLSNVFPKSNDESVVNIKSRQNSKESTTMYKMNNPSESSCLSSDSELEEMDFGEENTFETNTDEQREQTECNEEICPTDDNTCTDNSPPNVYMDVAFKEEIQNIDSFDSETLDGWEVVNEANTVETRCVLHSLSDRFRGKESSVPLPTPSDTRMSSSETISSMNTSFSKDTRSVMETEITPSISFQSEGKFDLTFANIITGNNPFSDLPSLTFQKQIEENSEEQEKSDTEPSEQNTSDHSIPVDNHGNMLRRSVHVQNSQDQTSRSFGEVISGESLNSTAPLIDTTEKTYLPLKCGNPNQLPPRVLEILSNVENIEAAESTINNASQHGGLRTVKTEPMESLSSDIEEEGSNDKETNNDTSLHGDACHSRTAPVPLIKPCSVVLDRLPYKPEADFDSLMMILQL